MSSPASRKRQRQRRRAREKLWATQSDLAAREADLSAYDRVVADMERRYRDGQLSPFGGAQAVSIVRILRDATKQDCAQLQANVTELVRACKALEPEAVSP